MHFLPAKSLWNNPTFTEKIINRHWHKPKSINAEKSTWVEMPEVNIDIDHPQTFFSLVFTRRQPAHLHCNFVRSSDNCSCRRAPSHFHQENDDRWTRTLLFERAMWRRRAAVVFGWGATTSHKSSSLAVSCTSSSDQHRDRRATSAPTLLFSRWQKAKRQLSPREKHFARCFISVKSNCRNTSSPSCNSNSNRYWKRVWAKFFSLKSVNRLFITQAISSAKKTPLLQWNDE